MYHAKRSDQSIFEDIIKRNNMPVLLGDKDSLEGKTIKTTVTDEYDYRALIFEDNTAIIYYTDYDSSNVEVIGYNKVYGSVGFDTYFREIFPEYVVAWNEWKQYVSEMAKKQEEASKGSRYEQYLRLKKEFGE